MAKGLRSKSKIASRNAKRYDPKTDYAIVQAARLHQTASRLASKNKSNRTVTDEEAGDDKMEEEVQADSTATDETDENGWYQRMGQDDDEWGYLILGLCDPDSFGCADVGTTGEDRPAHTQMLQAALQWLV